jgi:ABC-type branched-subunit amino acid transport system ATPase component
MPQAPARETLLEIRDLRKHFGGIVANDGISLDVRRGSIVGLIGPNGSGKTTLFNSIVRQHRVEGGQVRFEGRDLAALTSPQIARMGLIRTYQQAHVYEALTSRENLLISVSHAREGYGALLRKAGGPSTRKAAELLDFVGLADKSDELAGQLSYGERKLLELAMALMSDPQMLLLDEPTAGVNPAMIDRVIDRVRVASRSFGITLMIIEHNMRVVMDLAHEIHCLAHGKLLASGTPAQIRSDARVIDAYLGVR